MLKQWVNAETRIGRYSAVGEIFLLTFLFIGLVRVADYTAMWRFISRLCTNPRVQSDTDRDTETPL
jgi:hypothetical protein